METKSIKYKYHCWQIGELEHNIIEIPDNAIVIGIKQKHNLGSQEFLYLEFLVPIQ